ncbi:unnamed protein product [Brassica napus]|uniref:(rape) hypothetical protein n=1 Tax=Brassica napus TaxID=3708 RepID=A0A816P446_BRANA|nr:unnamed protein product [Brassica napus]
MEHGRFLAWYAPGQESVVSEEIVKNAPVPAIFYENSVDRVVLIVEVK